MRDEHENDEKFEMILDFAQKHKHKQDMIFFFGKIYDIFIVSFIDFIIISVFYIFYDEL